MVFFNFSKFHNFFSQNSFTGTKQILKQTKSWILVTPVIKIWKCHPILGCSGPKGPPSVGIGLIVKILGLYVKGLQSYQPSKFVNDSSGPGIIPRPTGSSGAVAGWQTFFGDLQHWQLVTLKPFNLQTHYLQYWKI